MTLTAETSSISLAKFGQTLTPEEVRLVRAFRQHDEEWRQAALFLAESLLQEKLRLPHGRLEQRLRRAHPCAQAIQSGFKQLSPSGGVRQWKCLGCGAIVTLDVAA